MIEDLDLLIKRLNSLQDLPTRAAPKIAAELKRQLESNIKAGVGPDGQAWQLRQDGQKALQEATKALFVSSTGSVIVAKLTGPEALHHKGAVKGKIRRQILPSKELPAPLVVAIKSILRSELGR